MAMRFCMDALRASTAFSPATQIIIAAMVAPIKRLDELRCWRVKYRCEIFSTRGAKGRQIAGQGTASSLAKRGRGERWLDAVSRGCNFWCCRSGLN